MQRSRRRTITLAVLLGGMVFLAVGGVIGAVFSDPPVRTPTTTTAPPTTTTLPAARSLGAVGAELDALIAAGRQVDHAAVYRVDDPDLPEGLVQSVEVWRKGPMFRSDVVERTGGGIRRQSSISGGAVARSCETVGGVETCSTATSVPSDLPAAFVAALVGADPEPELTVRDDDVAGYVARCFEAEGVGELCLAGDGVMLRLQLRRATIEATRIVDVVPDSAFTNAG